MTLALVNSSSSQIRGIQWPCPLATWARHACGAPVPASEDDHSRCDARRRRQPHLVRACFPIQDSIYSNILPKIGGTMLNVIAAAGVCILALIAGAGQVRAPVGVAVKVDNAT